MNIKYFEGWHGVRLAADVGGDPAAAPVILMHGAGQTRYSWGRAAAELVAMGYHVISLDLRGHGESTWAPDGDYSTDAFINDLKAVIATLPTPPVLIGASLGGGVSMMAVGESTVPLARALVLVDVVPRMNRAGVERIRDFMHGKPEGFASLEEAADSIARYLPHRPRPSNLEGLKRNLRLRDDGRYYWHWDPAFQVGAQRSQAGARRETAARQIRIPTLLVRGERSEVVSQEAVAELLAMIPHAKAVDVQGAGHMIAGDKNDAFNAAIRDFLEETAPTTATQNA